MKYASNGELVVTLGSGEIAKNRYISAAMNVTPGKVEWPTGGKPTQLRIRVTGGDVRAMFDAADNIQALVWDDNPADGDSDALFTIIPAGEYAEFSFIDGLTRIHFTAADATTRVIMVEAN